MSASELLRRHSDDLAKVISHPSVIASALYSRGIITGVTLEEASNDNKIASTRSINLLVAVKRGIITEQDKFQTFLDVLKEQLPHVDTLLNQIQLEYDNLQKDDVSTTNSVRHRPSRTREKRDTKEGEGEEEEDEVTTSAIIRVVIKGVGSVMLLSLFLWLVFLFIYKPPSPVTAEVNGCGASINKLADQSCHSVTPKLAYEELQDEISDSKSLAIHLGLSKVKRDIIDRENQSEREKLIEVLHACHDNDECMCWEDIATALEKHGNKRKASDIRKKYL